MRTAITVAKTHKGKWTMLGNPDVPLTEQLKEYRQFLGSKSHETYCYVQIQESDGTERHIHLMTPAAGEKHAELREKETTAAVEAGKKVEEEAKKVEATLAEERAKSHADEIERLLELARFHQ